MGAPNALLTQPGSGSLTTSGVPSNQGTSAPQSRQQRLSIINEILSGSRAANERSNFANSHRLSFDSQQK